MSKKPDLVVWDEVNGYNANLKSNPTNLGVRLIYQMYLQARSESSKKMLDVFEREKQEIIERIERLYDEYNTSVMVWESKISFEPIVGKTYYLYNFKNVKTLSLISPEEWDKYDSFIGEFTLTSDRKWVKTNKN